MESDGTIRRAFEDFRHDLFEPMCERNDKAHDAIFERLDKLNGWRNRMLGALALVAVVAPSAVAAVAWFK